MRLFIASLAVLVATAACSSVSQPAAESTSEDGGSDATSSISAVDNAFEPTEVELPAGEEATVAFTNSGDATHTFTSEELGFDSGSVEPGETVEVTVTAPTKTPPRLHDPRTVRRHGRHDRVFELTVGD